MGTTGSEREGKPTGVRERILDAALAVLEEVGVQGLTQVAVARRAGVRQSHLTYYFPTRDDLLESVTVRGVGMMTSGLRRAVAESPWDGNRPLLEELAGAVADLGHMRIFVAMIVEADGDPAIRRLMREGTSRMEAALAESIGGEDASDRARLILAAVWGLGLYTFLNRPGAGAELTGRYLSWLTEVAGELRDRNEELEPGDEPERGERDE
jgi:AcrR family transcriptional regulator